MARRMLPLLLLVPALVAGVPALAQSTAFTYQGELLSNGAAANGAFDLQFRLYDAPTAGAQLGATVCANNVSVVNGRFATTIDFGQQFATTSPRYIQLDVRADAGQACTTTSGYETLSPRMVIAATPLANHAKSAFALDAPDGNPLNAVSVDSAGLVGIGTTTPTATLHVVGGDLLIGALNEEWLFHTRSSFAGDFLHITDNDNGVAQFQHGLILHQSGNVGIGVTNPQAALDVNGSIRVAATARTISVHGSAFVPQYLNHPSFGTQGGLNVVDSFGSTNCGTVGYAGEFGPGVYFAPLQIPDGARIQSVCIDAKDTNASSDITVSVGRTSLATGLVVEVCTTFTSGGAAGIQHPCSVTVNDTVDNTNYVYFLKATMNTSGSNVHWLLAARVNYIVTSPLP